MNWPKKADYADYADSAVYADYAEFARCYKLVAAKPQLHFNVNIT